MYKIAKKMNVTMLEVSGQVHDICNPNMNFDEGLSMLYGALFVEVGSGKLPGLVDGEYTYLTVEVQQ
jgi:hypothetical protein